MTVADTATVMATREALHDLKQLQASCWQRQAMLTKIEQQLPLMTTAERSAMVDELAVFARACLNGTQETLRASIFAAEATQEQQAVTQQVERTLRPWMGPDVR